MSATLSLTKIYASMFYTCTEFAVSPYIATVEAFTSDVKWNDPEEAISAVLGSVLACTFFTIVIPVLPVCTLLTMSLAMIAAALATVSMFFTYPFALGMDLAEDCVDECAFSSNSDYVY